MKRRRKSKPKNSDSSAAEELPPSEAEFSYALTRVAVSQICRSVGFRASEFSALETLTLIATKYLERLAGEGASNANTASRTESNVFDVVDGLRDISFSFNIFPGGGSGTDARCLIRSGILREISDFVSFSPEIPFAKPVPRRKTNGTVPRLPHEPPASHIPAWLPSFPDSRLYRESSCEKKSSERLWENTTSVRESKPPSEISESVSSKGRYDGDLPEIREKVKFRLENKATGPETCGGAWRISEGLKRR